MPRRRQSGFATTEELATMLAAHARQALQLLGQPGRSLDGARAAVGALWTEVFGQTGAEFLLAADGERGDPYFVSALVQTLYYGLFAAWALPEQLQRPRRGLAEDPELDRLLARAEAVLAGVDQKAWFARLSERHAVQYFYEPFLRAFDPRLRKRLGVYYTPIELVRYQVTRADAVLREELGMAGGLTDPRVQILDPCCGTGAYLVEVLEFIAARSGAEAARHAALTRVLGFELLPAPLFIAHLQLALLLSRLGVPLSAERGERPGVYRTDALSGWDPAHGPKQRLGQSPEQLLCILGNPPYDGSLGKSDDLYLRFFRLAEERLLDPRTNPPLQGLVCYISNYLWLDGASQAGTRQRILSSFDRVYIDCLNGDKYKTGKLTPDGAPDPSVFATKYNRKGIQVGTAITLLVRQRERAPAPSVAFRHLWGRSKGAQLLSGPPVYKTLLPKKELSLSLLPAQVSDSYFGWPKLPELFPTWFPGVKTSRDELVVDLCRDRLAQRMQRYFDPRLSDAELLPLWPAAQVDTRLFRAAAVRAELLAHGFAPDRLVRYYYRPLDARWLYWEPRTNLLDRKRGDYFRHLQPGNVWMSAGPRNRKDGFYRPQCTSWLADHHIVESNAGLLPLYLRDDSGALQPNLSAAARDYLRHLQVRAEELFYHALAILHAPAYADENCGGLRQDWPRVPLPDSAVALRASAVLGQKIAALLDLAVPTAELHGNQPGTTELSAIATLRCDAAEPTAALAVTAGWGSLGRARITMPGRGLLEKRAPEAGPVDARLGTTSFDIFLSAQTAFCNVPERVWNYTLGGYQVLKKWLSYRETALLGRALSLREASEFTDLCRRIAALLLCERELADNYRATLATGSYMLKPPSTSMTRPLK